MHQVQKQPCVYILASGFNGTLYIGVTANLNDRVAIHRQCLADGFTKRYSATRLVYYEIRPTMPAAIRREKQLKKWNRLWKIRLIEQMNPEWRDLFDDFEGIKTSAPGGQDFSNR